MASLNPLPEYVSVVDAKPYTFHLPIKHSALLVIDMQRDFLLPQGFGAIQGGDLSMVQASIEPTKKLLDICRRAGLFSKIVADICHFAH